MSTKNDKKKSPNKPIELDLSDEVCLAVSDALLFILNLKDFSFEDEKISEDSASEAEDKLFYKQRVLTRGEVRAATKAVDIVLARFPGHAAEYSYMTEDFPDILIKLESELSILQEVQPRLHVYMRKLTRN